MPLFVKTIPSEDKGIMLARAQLERYWLASLSPTEQAGWRARWATRPPLDALGRSYIATQRTRLDQTTREEPTVYAWSQIFAFYRLGRSPVRMPTDIPAVPLRVSVATCTSAVVSATVTSDGALTPQFALVLHGTQPLDTSTRNIAANLRPLFACETVSDDDTIDVTKVWNLRFTRCLGRTVYFRASRMNANNELDRSEQLFGTPSGAP